MIQLEEMSENDRNLETKTIKVDRSWRGGVKEGTRKGRNIMRLEELRTGHEERIEERIIFWKTKTGKKCKTGQRPGEYVWIRRLRIA